MSSSPVTLFNWESWIQGMMLATFTAVGGENNWIGSFLVDFRVQVRILFIKPSLLARTGGSMRRWEMAGFPSFPVNNPAKPSRT